MVMNGTVTLSDEHYNGNYSFYLLRNVSSNNNCSLRFLYNYKFAQEYDGRTVLFRAKIYTPNNYAIIQIYNGSQYIEAQLPQNDKFEEITITTTIDYQKSYQFSITIHQNIDAYIDDVELIPQ